MKNILALALLTLVLFSCSEEVKEVREEKKESGSLLPHVMTVHSNDSSDLSCLLPSDELRERKETVLASLQTKVKEKRELENGYAFRFEGSDLVLDELNEFIKTERTCCGFFTFNLSISGDKTEVWLSLTGAEGTKEVIEHELEL